MTVYTVDAEGGAGTLSYDTTTMELVVDERSVEISDILRRVLELFLQRQNEVLNLDILHNEIWRTVIVEDNTVRKTVGHLRHALAPRKPASEHSGKRCRFIKTVRKSGYKLVAEGFNAGGGESSSTAVWAANHFSDYLTRGRYSAFSLAAAKDLLGSYQRLDDVLGQIEDEFPVPMEEGEYGDHDKWLDLLELCPDTGGVVALDGKEIVGYWQCLPIHDHVYEEVLKGKNVNKSISTDDIQILWEPGRYSLFFISWFMSDQHRSHVTMRLMRKHFYGFLHDCAKAGIFFRRIVANITGVAARGVCVNRAFKKVIDHPKHKYPERDGKDKPSEVFEMIVSRDGERFFQSDGDVAELYSNNGLFQG